MGVAPRGVAVLGVGSRAGDACDWAWLQDESTTTEAIEIAAAERSLTRTTALPLVLSLGMNDYSIGLPGGSNPPGGKLATGKGPPPLI